MTQLHMPYKAVLFDLDGTLLDTLNDLHTCVNYALTKHGLPTRSKAEIRSYLGNGMKNLIHKSLPNDYDTLTFSAVYDDFMAYYALHNCDTTDLYPGLTHVLEELSKTSVFMAVISNKANAAVQELKGRFFKDYFTSVVGEREGIARKPAPDAVNTLLKEFHIDKQDVVYIGDSEIDVTTATNAEIDCIAVTWGFRDKDQLEELKPAYLVDTPQELLSLLLGE